MVLGDFAVESPENEVDAALEAQGQHLLRLIHEERISNAIADSAERQGDWVSRFDNLPEAERSKLETSWAPRLPEGAHPTLKMPWIPMGPIPLGFP